MKSIILCEGSTDYALLQYFMRRVYGWQDSRTDQQTNGRHFNRIRTLTREDDKLSIAGCGGSSRILPELDFLLEQNSIANKSEAYHKIVVITDRDEVQTEQVFTEGIERILRDRNVTISENVCNDKWISCKYKNGQMKECRFELLLLIIPFEETGAMESFLLDAISGNDPYDEKIVIQGNRFVDNVDPDKRYLSKRRYITKAKFDVYFSVRTAAEQFVERQNILKNIEWEKYAVLQTGFAKLADLSA